MEREAEGSLDSPPTYDALESVVFLSFLQCCHVDRQRSRSEIMVRNRQEIITGFGRVVSSLKQDETAVRNNCRALRDASPRPISTCNVISVHSPVNQIKKPLKCDCERTLLTPSLGVHMSRDLLHTDMASWRSLRRSHLMGLMFIEVAIFKVLTNTIYGVRTAGSRRLSASTASRP